MLNFSIDLTDVCESILISLFFKSQTKFCIKMSWEVSKLYLHYWYRIMLNWNRNFLCLDFQVALPNFVAFILMTICHWLNLYTELNSFILKHTHFENYFSFTIMFEIRHIFKASKSKAPPSSRGIINGKAAKHLPYKNFENS